MQWGITSVLGISLVQTIQYAEQGVSKTLVHEIFFYLYTF